ncbi:unnamed protein product [Adineta ricciae]|uniref:LRRCT domain-containing protein n=1 Tax=Adineta ricciae TaxID=249248 RepID=A0A815EYK4_ADIRI|nr:unnamed protein product [Adineta ricciae]
MNPLLHTAITFVSLLVSIVTTDVCTDRICTCSKEFTLVNCDSKPWLNLSNVEFPTQVVTLTLINDKLNLDSSTDRSKIENLPRLLDLSLNQNPLGSIPPFNSSRIQSLSLDDTSLTSARFPPSYSSSILQKLNLNNNKIRSIQSGDFQALENSKLKRLHIDNAALTTVDQNAFAPLIQLQSLSLQNNQLKSCEFLSTLRVLSSIKLDGNLFTSLPSQLITQSSIKSFSFTNNRISIIDESSPLFTWQKENRTNIQVFLANNSFDCCQSLWFIRFLKISAHLVQDASILTCAAPSVYAGQNLSALNPDAMNCGGSQPKKWSWTFERIVAVSLGGFFIVLVVAGTIALFVRGRRSRTGYTEIGGVNDPLPTAPEMPTEQFPFPQHGEDNDDSVSTYSTAPSARTDGSQARSLSTAVGVSVRDEKIV